MTTPISLLKDELSRVLSDRWELGRVVRNKTRWRYQEATGREIASGLEELLADGKIDVRLVFDPEYGVIVAAWRNVQLGAVKAELRELAEALDDEHD